MNWVGTALSAAACCCLLLPPAAACCCLPHMTIVRAVARRRSLVSASSAAPDVIVCGAGVVGVACAHYLAKRGARVTIVDDRPPVSYTSSLSTECCACTAARAKVVRSSSAWRACPACADRNYWGGHAPMTAFMNRSIDLLEERAAECGNAFSMNRRGYCFLTRTAAGAARHVHAAAAAQQTGIGGGAVYSDGAHGVGYRGAELAHDARVDGLSVFQGREAISAFLGGGGLPDFVSPDVVSLLHAGRCGWMSAQQMGMQLLDVAREHGVRTLIPARARGLTTDASGRVSGVVLSTPDDDARHLPCGAVVNAAGPFASTVNAMMIRAAAEAISSEGEAAAAVAARRVLPLTNEVHAKAILRDDLGTVPMTAPMMIFEDEVTLNWSDEERSALLEMGGFEASLAHPLEGGAHFRPYPGATSTLLMLWEALHLDQKIGEPPPADPPLRGSVFSELLLRGLSPMVPRLGSYLAEDGSMVASVSVDGGYYTKTPDNLPLIGEVPGAPEGCFICAGLSGYGVMASNAAGELLAAQMAATGEALPSYARPFRPERWSDQGYCDSVAAGTAAKGLQI